MHALGHAQPLLQACAKKCTCADLAWVNIASVCYEVPGQLLVSARDIKYWRLMNCVEEVNVSMYCWERRCQYRFTIILPAMATKRGIFIIVQVITIILPSSLEVFAQRSCPPGKFCPIGANCINTTSCVIVCPTGSDHMQQGNHSTGNCERCKLCLACWSG